MSNNIFKGIALFLGFSVSLGILVIGVLSLRSYLTKASGSSEPKMIRSASITDVGAQILWDTPSESQGMVRYATDPTAFKTGNSGSLLYMAESTSGTTHSVKLSGLKPNTTYFYEISIGKDVFDQSGLVKEDKHLPFSLTTVKTESTTSESIPGLDPETFRQKFGSSDPLYDLNKDGVVNSTDYLLFLSRTTTPAQ